MRNKYLYPYFLLVFLLIVVTQGCASIPKVNTLVAGASPALPPNVDIPRFVTPKLHVSVQLDALEITTNSKIKKNEDLQLILMAAYNEQAGGTQGQLYQTLVPQSIDKDFLTVTLNPTDAIPNTTTYDTPNIILFDDYWQMDSTNLKFKILQWNEVSPSARNRLNTFISSVDNTGKLVLDTSFVTAASVTLPH